MEETLITALKSAGDELMRHFGRQTGFSIKESQSSIVTHADLKSDDLISEIIRKDYPEHNILSEESGFSNRNSDFTWVVDPLDGTSNFASSIPWFGVLIAILEGDRPVMGGAYLPATNQLYLAYRGKGARKNGKRITMPESMGLRNSLVSFNVDFTDDEKVLDSGMETYKRLVRSARNIRCTNSLVDFLFTAEGKFGGVINLFTRIWDIAALGLIIEEAGGAMKYVTGKDIIFRLDSDTPGTNYPVVAGPPKILEELYESVLNGKSESD